MHVARGIASWLSSHGRGLGTRDTLKKDSRGLSRGDEAGSDHSGRQAPPGLRPTGPGGPLVHWALPLQPGHRQAPALPHPPPLPGCRRVPVAAQRVLEEPGELGVSVGHVHHLLALVPQGADHVAQGQLRRQTAAREARGGGQSPEGRPGPLTPAALRLPEGLEADVRVGDSGQSGSGQRPAPASSRPEAGLGRV